MITTVVLPDGAADEASQLGEGRVASGCVAEMLPHLDTDFPVAGHDVQSAAQAGGLDEVGCGTQDFCGRAELPWGAECAL